MPRSPYTRDQLADARHLVTHAQNFRGLGPVEYKDVLSTAWAVLREDRAARLRPCALNLTARDPGNPGDAA